MLKYLLGIVTALIFVAAFVIWFSVQDNTATTPVAGDRAAPAGPAPTGDGATSDDGTTGGSTLFPRSDTEVETRGLNLDTGDEGPIATAPMRREVIPTLGFAIDVPEAWVQLDATGMRRYFSEFLGLTDQQQVDALVSSIVLATIRSWPQDGDVANVIINHKLEERRDVVQILNTMLDNKRGVFETVDVIAPPSQGQLGPFWGGSMRTRETTTTDGAAKISETVTWILRVGDGYMFITAEAPANDEEGLALIERMLSSVSGARDSG